mgnify:CR=1 FL=1
MADVFNDLLGREEKTFISSFIMENIHELECSDPRYIYFDPTQKRASVQDTKNAKENMDLVVTISEAWYSRQIVVVLKETDTKFHVLKITRPTILNPVEITPGARAFMDQLATMKKELAVNREMVTHDK